MMCPVCKKEVYVTERQTETGVHAHCAERPRFWAFMSWGDLGQYIKILRHGGMWGF